MNYKSTVAVDSFCCISVYCGHYRIGCGCELVVWYFTVNCWSYCWHDFWKHWE